MQTYSNTDLAWAAGFIDGEGCFYISRTMRGKRPVFMAGLSVSQVSDLPLQKLTDILGGKVYNQRKPPNPKWADIWQWRAHSASALRAAEALIPYLVLKRPHAELIVEFCQGISPDHIWGRHGLPIEEVQRRDSLRERLAYLNRKGPR